MSKKRFDFRLAVGAIDGPQSSVWHFWSRNSEVYAAHRGFGGVQKFSFHTPNICRLAPSKVPGIIRKPAISEWRRDPTPAVGSGRVVRVLRIGFATDLLSSALERPARKIIWIEPAPAGSSTVLDLMFTRDNEASFSDALAGEPASIGHKLLVYQPLPNEEAFCISRWYSPEADKTLRMPASHGHTHDLIVYPRDPDATGRPIRLTIFSRPKDGDLMNVWEMGAYAHAPLTDDQWKAMVDAL
jgi:hypothetical protein